MRDINFFKPYKSNDKGGNHRRYYQVTTLIIATLIITTFSINICKIIILNEEIKMYESKLNDREIKNKVKVAEEISRQLDAVSQYDKDIDSVISIIDNKNTVSNELLESINKTVPKSVNFKSMNINNESIMIQAITTDRKYIAEIQHNLKLVDKIDNVHVESISSDETVNGEYTFNIKCSLTGR